MGNVTKASALCCMPSHNVITTLCMNHLFYLDLWPGTTSSDTYIPKTLDPKEISGNHNSYMKSLGFKEDNLSDKFPSFYWTPELHKTPYKHRFIILSFDCTTKPLFLLLTHILSAIKGKLLNLSSVMYSRTGINEM